MTSSERDAKRSGVGVLVEGRGGVAWPPHGDAPDECASRRRDVV